MDKRSMSSVNSALRTAGPGLCTVPECHPAQWGTARGPQVQLKYKQHSLSLTAANISHSRGKSDSPSRQLWKYLPRGSVSLTPPASGWITPCRLRVQSPSFHPISRSWGWAHYPYQWPILSSLLLSSLLKACGSSEFPWLCTRLFPVSSLNVLPFRFPVLRL